MKVNFIFKMPDAVYQALQDLPEEERERAETVINKFVKWGEVVEIEVDIDAETAIVLPS